CDESRDTLAGERLAALREAYEHLAIEARHADCARRRPRHEPHEPRERALALLAPPLELQLRNDLREHLLARELPVADLGEHDVFVVPPELFQHALEGAVLPQRVQLEVVPPEVALEDLAADGDRALALLRLHVGADAGAGARRLCDLEPVLRRLLRRRRDDLDRVAALELVAKRHDATIYARAGAVPT